MRTGAVPRGWVNEGRRAVLECYPTHHRARARRRRGGGRARGRARELGAAPRAGAALLRGRRLTATEYELLRLLTANAGRVSTYESLIRRLWREPAAGDPDRVRTFVKQLRRKLGDDPARPRWILNERGVGYRVPRPEE